MEKNPKIIYGSRNGQNLHNHFDNLENLIKDIPSDKNLDDITIFLIFKLFGFDLEQYQDNIEKYSFSNNSVQRIELERKNEYSLIEIIPIIKNVIIEDAKAETKRSIKNALDFVFNGFPKKENILDIDKVKSSFLINTLKSK